METNQTAVNEPTVTGFIEHYGRSFVADDLDELARIYDYPSAIFADEQTLLVTEPQQVRDFFAPNGDRFRSRGLVDARAEVLQVTPAGQGGLAVVNVRWSYLTEQGNEGDHEFYVYVLRLTGDAPTICAGIPSAVDPRDRALM